jgi:hypothetical protein
MDRKRNVVPQTGQVGEANVYNLNVIGSGKFQDRLWIHIPSIK